MITLIKITDSKAIYLLDNDKIIPVELTSEASKALDYFNKLPANKI